MNSRERFRKAIWRKEPDRVPVDLGGIASTIEAVAYRDLLKHLNRADIEVKCIARDHADPDEFILEKFSIDTRYVRIKAPKGVMLFWNPTIPTMMNGVLNGLNQKRAIIGTR